MGYKGGCLIGVEVPLITNKTLSVDLYAAPGVVDDYTRSQLYAYYTSDYNDPPWQIMDGGNTPGYIGTRLDNSAIGFAAAKIPVMYGSFPYEQGLYVHISPPTGNAWTLSYPRTYMAASGGTITEISVTALYKQMVNQIDWDYTTQPFRALFCDYQINNYPDFYASFTHSNNSTIHTLGGIWGEACPIRFIETPNNVELISFRYQQKDDNSQTAKTLDGVQRVVTTGQPAADISATFRWSDDGTTARNLQELLYIASALCRPFLLWIPKGIYYAGPLLELLIPSSPPTITMPAPGVYEITIEGRCQP